MSLQLSARRIGVILAAGRGRRMGRTKQLVSWPSSTGPKSLVASAYDAICSICDEMVVVVGHEADVVAAALGERPFHRVECDADAPMFGSIRAGLETALAIDPHAAVVLQPGDHPEVLPGTLNTLVEWSYQQQLQAIIPVYRGRGGHPAIIPSAVVTRILEVDCPTGLGDFWRANPALCLRIPLHDPAVCLDIDTPADLPTD